MITERSTGIPVIEWPIGDSNWTADEMQRVAAAVGDACRHSGYFFLKNHGVPAHLIAAVFEETRQFYGRPLDQKRRFSCSADSQFLGYRRLGAEKSRMHPGAESCEQYRIGNVIETPASSELVEFYHEPFRHGVILLDELAKVGDGLMRACAASLGLVNTFFDCFMETPMHRLGLNYYQVGANKVIGNSVDYAMTPHVDLAVLTIVTQDELGLEVLNADGDWMDVPVIPDVLFVFLGDFMERWTNGAYHAAKHRVGKVSKDRFSIQYKHKPSYATVVTPLSQFAHVESPMRYEPFDMGRQYALLLESILTT